MPESVQARSGGLFLETKEPARDLAMHLFSLEDSAVNHGIPIIDLSAKRWDRVMALGRHSPLT